MSFTIATKPINYLKIISRKKLGIITTENHTILVKKNLKGKESGIHPMFIDYKVNIEMLILPKLFTGSVKPQT